MWRQAINNASLKAIGDQENSSRLTVWLIGVTVALPFWFLSYYYLEDFASFILSLTTYDRSTHLGEALHFFFYDTPKVLLPPLAS